MIQDHTHTVLINELSLLASIGILESERKAKQRLLVSLKLQVRTPDAVKSGKIEDAVCYGEITEKIKALVNSQHFDLLETLAQKIVESCIEDNRIASYQLTLEKPDIIEECRSVAIQIEGLR